MLESRNSYQNCDNVINGVVKDIKLSFIFANKNFSCTLFIVCFKD